MLRTRSSFRISLMLYLCTYADVDECATLENDCHENANCTNNVGSYYCTCITGYTGNGTLCEGMTQTFHKDLVKKALYIEFY